MEDTTPTPEDKIGILTGCLLMVLPVIIMVESMYVSAQVYNQSAISLFVFGFPVWLYAAVKLFPILFYPLILGYLGCQAHMFYLYGEKVGYTSFYHLTWYAYPVIFVVSLIIFLIVEKTKKA